MDAREQPRRRGIRSLGLAGAAHVAEIFASIAVLVTLVFLVIEVRHNTEVTRAAAYDRSVDALNHWRLTVADNPDLAARWQAYVAQEEQPQLTNDIRLQLVINTLWAIYESSFYARQYDLLGASEWNRHRVQICVRYRSDEARWTSPEVGQPIRHLLTPEFVRYVETNC